MPVRMLYGENPQLACTLLHAVACIMMLQEVVIVGGLEMQNQAKALARRPHVVVATPGRLKVCTSCIIPLRHHCHTVFPVEDLFLRTVLCLRVHVSQ